MKKEKSNVFTRKITNYEPDDSARTTIVDCGDIKESKTIERVSSNLAQCKRISKDLYYNTVTGEVGEYQHKERTENKSSFKKSFDNLRCIINTNIKSDINELHVVLKYSKEMKDFDKASKDFKSFWEKLKYRYKDLEFIKIIEPHETGSWHIHVLLKSTTYCYLFIPEKELTEMWGHGFVYVKKIKDNDNIGAYFTPCFKELDTFIRDSEVSTDRKCIVKASRLKFYPNNKKFYSYSKGIKKPKRIVTTYGEAKEILNFEECVYKYANEIYKKDPVDDSELILNHHLYMQFNSKRKKKS